jgi:CRP-like cAMP-binding protein
MVFILHHNLKGSLDLEGVATPKRGRRNTMIIEQAELFKGMNRDFIKEIMKMATKESITEGPVLFEEGNAAQYFYIMLKGRIKLRTGTTGHMVHTVSRAGEAFGWSSLVGRTEYSASAECLAPTRVVRLDRDDFEDIVAKDPESGLLFFKRVARIIGERLVRSYHAHILGYPSEEHKTYGSTIALQQTGSETVT